MSRTSGTNIETSTMGETVRAFVPFPLPPRVPAVTRELGVSKPTAQKAIELLTELGVLHEIGQRDRGRRYGFTEYLNELGTGIDLPPG